MSNASKVKRYFITTVIGNSCIVSEEPVDGLDNYTEMVPAADHDRIVAELKAEIEQQSNAYEFALDNHVHMQLTIARQAREIEKLREQRNAVIKAANQDGLEYGSPKNWDKELEDIKTQGEGT